MSLDICAAIPFCKNCFLLSHRPKSFPSPTAVSLSTHSQPHRHHQIHLRRPFFAPLSATPVSSDTERDNFLSEDSEHYEEQTSSDDEEAENFDVLEFERQAKQVVKEYSDSLSRELKIGSFLELLNLGIPFIVKSLHFKNGGTLSAEMGKSCFMGHSFF